MTQTYAEILLMVTASLSTGFLVFIAVVLQHVMNDLDEASFQRFLLQLDKKATHSAYAVGVSTLPFIGMIPYWIVFGFTNLWFSAGLVVFLLASVASKTFNLPIYKRIFALDSSDTEQLGIERQKLQLANRIRAFIQLASIMLMVVGFL